MSARAVVGGTPEIDRLMSGKHRGSAMKFAEA